jgi:hypothetical protein
VLEYLPGQTPEEDGIEQEQEDQVEDDEAEENEADEHGRMPGQLNQQVAVIQPDYKQRKRTAKEKVKALLGEKTIVKHKKQQTEWTVVEEWEPQSEMQDLKALGLVDFPVQEHSQSEILASCTLLLLIGALRFRR